MIVVKTVTQTSDGNYIPTGPPIELASGPSYETKEFFLFFDPQKLQYVMMVLRHDGTYVTPQEYVQTDMKQDTQEQKDEFLDHFNHYFSLHDIMHVVAMANTGTCSLPMDQVPRSVLKLVELLQLDNSCFAVNMLLKSYLPVGKDIPGLWSEVTGLNQSIRDVIYLKTLVEENPNILINAMIMGWPPEQGYLAKVELHDLRDIQSVRFERSEDGILDKVIDNFDEVSVPHVLVIVRAGQFYKKVGDNPGVTDGGDDMIAVMRGLDSMVQRGGPSHIGNRSVPAWEQKDLVLALLQIVNKTLIMP